MKERVRFNDWLLRDICWADRFHDPSSRAAGLRTSQRITERYQGTSEIQGLVIARHLLWQLVPFQLSGARR